MLSYATIGVTDLEKSEAFYNELLAPIGAKTLIKMDRIIFIGKSMKEPMLAICIPMYHKAIALGATCDGEPGQRIPDVFYGAYFRDLDGNKIVFNHFG